MTHTQAMEAIERLNLNLTAPVKRIEKNWLCENSEKLGWGLYRYGTGDTPAQAVAACIEKMNEPTPA